MKLEPEHPTSHTPLRFIWLVVFTVIMCQRPICSPNLWWNLAHGREVFTGSFSPSSTLLALDSHAEADWLSGLPFYFLWGIGGVHLLAAIPIVVGLGILFTLQGPLRQALGPTAFLLSLPLFLWSLRDGLAPAPQLFDIAGMFVLWKVLFSTHSYRTQSIAIFVIFLTWANLGPTPLWGIMLLLFSNRLVQLQQVKQKTAIPLPLWRWLLLALLGAICTPRSWLTWRDSLILFSPRSFANVERISEPGWQAAWLDGSWSLCEWSLLLLWSLWMWYRARAWQQDRLSNQTTHTSSNIEWSTIASGVTFSTIPLLAPLLAQKNIPLSALWILLDLVSHRMPRRNRKSNEAKLSPIDSRERWQFALAVIVALVGFLEATGLGVPTQNRWGWGIAREIDPRLFNGVILDRLEEDSTGWAPDGLSVGIVAWLDGNVKMLDHPQRALLGGRLQQTNLLLHDLEGAHRAHYRRDDGSWGGWVRQMADWKVSLIVIPFEKKTLLRELIRSPWQAVDLDSPSIPFVSTASTTTSPLVLQSLQQGGFVEFGPWQATSEIYSGIGWRFNFLEMIGCGIDPAPPMIQSQIFHAMDLPVASLRALLPVRTHCSDRWLLEEFLTVQIAVAYQEWNTFGTASRFRKEVIHALTRDASILNQPWVRFHAEEVDQAEWRSCVELYLRGDLAAAVEKLPSSTPSQHFAKAMIWLELGDCGRVLSELDKIIEPDRQDSTSIAANYWREQVEQFYDR